MATDANYGVDIYQLNVGQGDGAIYVQYEILANKTRKALSMVLIDGGDGQTTKEKRTFAPWDVIKGTIEKIRTEFKDSGLRFDSIVVTHWDSDHVQGVIEFIMADLRAGQALTPKRETCQFLKYDSNSKPQTVIYFPYWRANERSTETSLTLLKGAESRTAIFAKQKEAGNEVDIMEWYLAMKDGPVTVKNVNLIRHTPETMLGVDFFLNNTSPVGKNHKNVTSLAKLLSMEAGVDKNKPGLLCISTDRVLLGWDGKSLPMPTITGGATTNMNKVSIVTLVVWRTKEEISYYAAGDMDEQFEERVVSWTQADSKPLKVKVVKASHHGAAGSFPQTLIQTWEPDSIIFSQGNRHFHPAWEIVYWISLETVYATPKLKPIWATGYPYWLTRINVSDPPVFEYQTDEGWNRLASLFDDSHNKKYLEGLEKLYAAKKAPAGALAIEPIKEELDKLFEKGYEEERANYLLCCLANAWENYSNTASSRTHFTGLKDSSGKAVTCADQVWYILIQCTSLETTVEECTQTGFAGRTTTVTKTSPLKPPVAASKAATKRKAGGTGARAAPAPAKKKKGTRSLLSTARKLPEVQSSELVGRSQMVSSTTAGGYLIYAKEIDGETVEHYIVTAEQQRIFIEQLNREVLELEMSFKDAGDNIPVNFQATDEVYNWFETCLSATTLSARGAGEEANHFDMEVTFTDSYLLKFSTEAVPLQFKIEEPLSNGPLSEQWGLLNQFPIMIFGLSQREPDFETRIEDVYTFAGFSSKPLFDTRVKLIYPASANADTLFQRNAIWFMPSEGYSTTMRLNFWLTEMDTLNEFLRGFLGQSFSVDDANIVVRKSCTYNLLEGSEWNATISSEIILGCTARISDTSAKITSVLSDNEEDMDLIINFEGASLANMLSWLNELLGTTFNLELPTDITGDPSLRRIELTFENNKCTYAAVTFQLSFKFGAESGKLVVFFLTYAWPQNQLMGSLYPGINQDPYNFLYPEYEPYRALTPYVDNEDALPEGLNLAYIIPSKTISVPEHVLPTVTSANVILGSDQIFFAGQLEWNSSGGFVLPIVKFDTINLSAMHNWKTHDTELYLDVRAQLVPRRTDLLPADLFGAIGYDGDNWTFEFMLNNLYLSTLYSFFDDDVKEGVMDMLETVEIDVLWMNYVYSPSGRSSTFSLAGTVLLGAIKASCEYAHDLSGWTFRITVGPNSPEATIGDVMRSLMGQDTFLPSCVDNIKVPTSPTLDTFVISVTKENISGDGEYVVFNGQCNLDILRFSFVQLRKAGVGASISTKRVFKIGVGRLPSVDVPLIGEIAQVFDEMAFLWVDDSAPNGQGLTRNEVDIINRTVFETDPDNRIRFKESKPQASTQQPNDLVLQKGLHFVIALNVMGTSKVILDHRFGETRRSSAGTLSTTDNTPAGSGETTMAPMEKKIGALSISNIGLQFLDDVLYIVLDATFELGPLKMSLLGFGLGINLSGEFNLQHLPTSLEVRLEGLAVGFEKPPLTLAGLFQYAPPLYKGGIVVGFIPYSFLAAGFYGDMGRYKTVFLFAKLSGPLITIAFAEISGICGGFGYNNTIGFPTITQVPDYPFINNDSLGSDPVDVLRALTGSGGWVQPKENVNWFAVGLSVKAFGLLDVDAVVAVEFNPYVKLGIFALAQAGFPTKASGGARFLYVALGIGAVVDFEAGIMTIQGQLTPNSFILAPSCHLTGGFGLCYWFGPNDHAGDWVFTIGGYHPSFIKPAHYPDPPRLGVSWQVDSAISITGESYFAITPKCCMAGIRLHAVLSLGPLGAWFLAQVNVLINFDPFYFQGDVRVAVGVSFTLRLFIVTLRIKVEIGATLYIRGPPFGGRVHVNFWVFGFSINFGADANRPGPVTLGEFWQMCLQDGVRASRTDGQDHVLVVASGLLPTSTDSEKWDVRGGIFSFMIQSRFPIKTATVTGGGQVTDLSPFYSKPMQLQTGISASTMTIAITKQVALKNSGEDQWLLTRVITNVPDALFGKYNRSEDPMVSGNQIGGLLNPDEIKIPLTMSITVSSPKPVLAPDNIPKFNVIHAMAVDVNKPTERPRFAEYPDDIGRSSKPDAPETEGDKQWIKVRDAWDSPTAKEISQSVLATWREAYKWQDVAVVALPPKNALKKFLTVYMAAPLICA